MAKLLMTEHRDLNGVSPVAQVASLVDSVTQNKTIGVVATFAAIGVGKKLIRLHAEADCYITYGEEAPDSPTVNDTKLTAGHTEYFEVAPGGILKVYDGVS